MLAYIPLDSMVRRIYHNLYHNYYYVVIISLLALPMRMGAWSMACVLWRRIEYYYIIISLSLSPFIDAPTITNMDYIKDNQTLTCISSRSPATVVSWMNDGVIINESSTHYTLTQTLTDRASSTYTNVLTINEIAIGGDVTGTWTCTVSNKLGSDSKEIVIVGEFN